MKTPPGSTRDDAIQECARIALERQGPRFQDPGDLFNRVKFDCRDHYKKIWRRIAAQGPTGVITDCPDADEVDVGLGVDVRDAVDALPAELAVVVRAVWFEGKTQDEIGAQLGLTQSAVARRMGKAFAALRDTLSAYAPETT